MNHEAENKYSLALQNDRANGDPKQTLSYLECASELGSLDATYALGSLYLYGKHVEQNAETAVKYLTQAAIEMHPQALMDLALGSERGDLLPEDPPNAFKNYFLAMLTGDTEALYEVARCFYYGIGTEVNLDIYEIIMTMHDWKTSSNPDSPE